MDVVSETVSRGVVERRFDLKVGDEVVPGLFWSPEGASGPRPVVLIGHGGTEDKRTGYVLSLARRLVRHHRYAAVAIDAPEHGERITDPEAFDRLRRSLQARVAAGPGAGPAFSPEEAAGWVERTARGAAEWHALLDTLDAEGPATRYGYWGLSMGTAIGLPMVAAEPRIAAAVLGLAGLRGMPGAEDLERSARRLQVPVLFIQQWDDELVGRRSGLDLFDAIGSAEKTLHVNPGGHVATPAFEVDAYEEFLRRHLGPADDGAGR